MGYTAKSDVHLLFLILKSEVPIEVFMHRKLLGDVNVCNLLLRELHETR